MFSESDERMLMDDGAENITEKKATIDVFCDTAISFETTAMKSGYETDNEEALSEQKRRKYKNRLILGDGNFSYSRALIKKRTELGYSNFGEAITATEFNTEDNLRNTYVSLANDGSFKNAGENIDYIKEHGASVLTEIDASKIHEIFGDSDKHFNRIHFNFPYYHDSEMDVAEKKAETRRLVGKFFSSASKIQNQGDRIHMALATGYEYDPVWYENSTYGIAEFCEENGYAYIKKRFFISQTASRYQGYSHVKTNSNRSVTVAEEGREFIFEKKVSNKYYEDSTKKATTARGKQISVLIDRDTDPDTSDYTDGYDDCIKEVAESFSVDQKESNILLSSFTGGLHTQKRADSSENENELDNKKSFIAKQDVYHDFFH